MKYEYPRIVAVSINKTNVNILGSGQSRFVYLLVTMDTSVIMMLIFHS